jgi:hypothetical protein
LAINQVGAAIDRASAAPEPAASDKQRSEVRFKTTATSEPQPDIASIPPLPGVRQPRFVRPTGQADVASVPNTSNATGQPNSSDGVQQAQFIMPIVEGVADRAHGLSRDDGHPVNGSENAEPIQENSLIVLQSRPVRPTLGAPRLANGSPPGSKALNEGRTPNVTNPDVRKPAIEADIVAGVGRVASQTPQQNQAGKIRQQAMMASETNRRTSPAYSHPAPAGTVSPEVVISPLSTVADAVVGTERRQGAIATLGKQMTMRQDERLPREPINSTPAQSARATAKSKTQLDESFLLQPFHATNRNSAQPGSSPGDASIATNAPSNRLPEGKRISLPFGSLVSQWTMSAEDDLRRRPHAPSQSSITSGYSGQARRDDGWTFVMPSMINPFTMAQDPATLTATRDGVQQVAYAEETIPEPPDLKIEGGEPSAASATGGGTATPTLADAEKLGEEPEDTSLQFLRESTVLLRPGQSQFDIGITYLLSESEFPILLTTGGVAAGVEHVDFRIRELTVPMQYRIGLLKRVQAFVGAEVGWSNAQVSINSNEAFQNDGGFGDVDFGATIQLVDGHAEKPHVLATVSATAPTGGDPFGAAVFLAPTAPSLGQGFWSVSGRVLCIHSYDPVVFFYGVGGEQTFSRNFGELEIEPGTIWNYSFGVGFAVNDRVTLSTRFLGAYAEEVRINRERRFGTNFEPMTLRLAATISKPNKRLVEPFTEFGLTEGTVSNYFGVTWTY